MFLDVPGVAEEARLLSKAGAPTGYFGELKGFATLLFTKNTAIACTDGGRRMKDTGSYGGKEKGVDAWIKDEGGKPSLVHTTPRGRPCCRPSTAPGNA